jgi:hypothetical protein
VIENKKRSIKNTERKRQVNIGRQQSNIKPMREDKLRGIETLTN